MKSSASLANSQVSNPCPPWCVTGHGVHLGEEDWVHASEPLAIRDVLVAQLCVSIDPDTGTRDGPHVLIGSSELSLAETDVLGNFLLELAAKAMSEHDAPT
jgi:hypothetical protein